MITATSNVTVVVVAAAFDTTAVAAFSATDTAVFASCRITARPLPVADNWIDGFRYDAVTNITTGLTM